MTDKELKKLGRTELLEMLLAQSKEMEKLKEQLKRANEMLEDRRIIIDNAGSLAEAALQLNGVFEAAQKAAAQYLENIQRQAQTGAGMEQKNREGAETRLPDAQIPCGDRPCEAQKKCERAVQNTKPPAPKHGETVSGKAAQQTETRAWLKKLLDSSGSGRK